MNVGLIFGVVKEATAMKTRTTTRCRSSLLSRCCFPIPTSPPSSPSSPFLSSSHHGHRRSLAVMVMGHGWTGALGTGRLDQYIAGHEDEDDFHDVDYQDDDNDSDNILLLPVTIYNSGPVRMARTGWGHTAVITTARHDDNDDDHEDKNDATNQNRRLLLTGRAHDFQNLLRLHRMPEWMRNQITKRQQQQKQKQHQGPSSSSSSSSSSSYLDRLLALLMQNFGASGGESSPATRSSSASSHDSNESFGGGGASTKSSRHAQENKSAEEIMRRDWQVAADMNLLTSLTEINRSVIPYDENIMSVACSAGLTALVTRTSSSSNGSNGGGGGFVYTFGVNSFGQCGVGVVSNNIWQPTRVITTSRQNQKQNNAAALLPPLSSSSPRKHQLLETDTTTTTTTTSQNEDDHDDRIDTNNSSSSSSIVNSSPSSPSSSSPLTTLSNQDNDDDDMDDNEQEQYLRNITSIALGLQHGVCLNESGQVFCFGKGDRGQLGLGKFLQFTPTAELVQQYCILQQQPSPPNQDVDDIYNNKNNYNPTNPKPIYKPLGPVKQVAAGLLHTAALTRDNQVLIWGKNVLPPLAGDGDSGKAASDANIPCQLHLPTNHDDDSANKKVVLEIACGSHHTAMLLEDGSVYGVGISSGGGTSSSKVPIFEPVLLIPPGLVEMPVRQFAAHMDRTTVVGASGQQVLQVQLQMPPTPPEISDDDNNKNDTVSSSSSITSTLLWGDDAAGASLSTANAYFTPAWMDRLLEHDPHVRVQEVHRGWLHTVIVTDHVDNDDDETNKNANHDIHKKTTV